MQPDMGSANIYTSPGSKTQNVTFTSVSAKNAKWRSCLGFTVECKVWRCFSRPLGSLSKPLCHLLSHFQSVLFASSWQKWRARYSHGCAVMGHPVWLGSGCWYLALFCLPVCLLTERCSAYRACFYRRHCLYMPFHRFEVFDKHYAYHPRCRLVCFFIGTDLEKFSITSLAQQWILCREWVPSECW